MKLHIKLLYIFSLLYLNIAFSNSTDSLRRIIFKEKQNPKTQISAIYKIYDYYLYRDADSCLILAEKLNQLNLSKSDTITAAAHSIKGVAYYFKADYPKAISELDSALAIESKLNRKAKMAKIYSNLANVHNNLSEYDKSLSYSIKSLDIWKGLKQKIEVAMSLYEIGNTYRHLKEHEKAIKYFEEALQIAIEEKDQRGIAACHSNLGNCYQMLKQFDKAQEHLETNLKIVTELNLPIEIATAYNNLGILFMAKKDYATSYNYHKKAEKIRKEKNNKNGLLNSYMNLARVLFYLKRYNESEKYALEGFDMAQKQSNKKMTLTLARVLYENYNAQNKYKEAFKFLELHSKMQDSVMNVEKVNKINELEAQFQNEKKALEIDNLKQKEELQQEEIDKQNMQKLALAIGFGLTGVLAFVILSGYRRKKHDNELITLQKHEVEIQKELIQEKHKEITDSINYAERIQKSFMASEDSFKNNLNDYFIFFKPKDIVSGDFYWSEKTANDYFYLCAADSTGHGVPGAIMSILNITCLENALKEGISEPSEILNHTRTNIIERLKKDGSTDGGKDGMDCALLRFDLTNKRLKFSMANNPVWVIKNGNLEEHKPDKMPVGKHEKQHYSFSQKEIDLNTGDLIYIFTDGYADQFGGPKGKKFMYKQLKELLLSICHLSMYEQREKLKTALIEWKNHLEQVDDICVIGIKI